MDHVLLLTPQLTPGVFTQEARTAQPGCVRSGAFLKRAGKDLGVLDLCRALLLGAKVYVPRTREGVPKGIPWGRPPGLLQPGVAPLPAGPQQSRASALPLRGAGFGVCPVASWVVESSPLFLRLVCVAEGSDVNSSKGEICGHVQIACVFICLSSLETYVERR